MLFMQNLSKFAIARSSLGIFSTVAGQNVSGGGGELAEPNIESLGERPRKVFEIFIPEIAANASNDKN